MTTNKPLRFLEIIWIVIGFTGVMLSFYTYLNDNKGQSAYFFIIAIVSVIMFNIRKRQRKKLESELPDKEPS